MNSEQLLKFKTVVECGTLSKAAERLYITQPSLSYTLASLENELECTLFLREKNKLILTAAGKELYQYATQVSDILSRAESAMKKQNKISLSATNFSATILLSHCSDEELNNIRLVLADESDFPALLLNGTLDAAACDDHYMRELMHDYPEIELEKHMIFEEHLGLLLPPSHKLYEKEFATYEDIDGVSLCVQADASALMLWLKNIEKIRNVPFQLDYPFDHITLEHIRYKLNCAEIRRCGEAVTSPNRDKVIQQAGYRFIPIEGVYSRRCIYLWNLKEKHRKIRPLLTSLDAYNEKNIK